MDPLAWFIPGRPGALEGPLARYRPVQPVRAVRAYVQNLTRPDDLVVDLFCQGPVVVREALAAGRRALGLSANPLLLVAASLGLSRPDANALNAAFTRLADSPKGDMPLHRYLNSLYRSSCPVCGTQGITEWFAWDRDGNYPFKKAVRCPQCEKVQEGAPDDEDVASAQHVQPRGLAYYYALDRAAPPDHPARERAAELVALYTPRNLSALMDLVMRLDGLDANKEVKLALTGVLLDCLDAGSSLDPYGEARPRPRTLHVPPMYVERNVWLCFEERFSRWLNEEAPLPAHQVADVSALVKGEAQGYALVSHAARDVRKSIQLESAALIVTDPPRPDAVFWALSALWAGWLWDSPAAHALRPFLGRRRFDWDWYWRMLWAALKAAGPLLTAEGHLLTLFSDPDGTLLESVCLATSNAGFVLVGWGTCPQAGYRLVWRWEEQTTDSRLQIAAPDVEVLGHEVEAVAGEAAVNTLRERGEPTFWPLLHASIYVALTRQGLLARAAAMPEDSPPALDFAADAVHRAREAAPLVRLAEQRIEEALWWLTEPHQAAVEPPLADRVEARVWELLLRQPLWNTEELVNAVYADFSGPLTPDLALVLVCADSYSFQEGETVRLRPEDDPIQRAAELKVLREDLGALGRQLGFQVKRKDGWDVRWLEEGREACVFAISETAALGTYLLAPPRPTQAQRCLVLPGGRAQLVTFKLQRDPRLNSAAAAGGWQFIKFRHLRRLLAEKELDRYAFKTVLGLDPIVEQEAAQIPLF